MQLKFRRRSRRFLKTVCNGKFKTSSKLIVSKKKQAQKMPIAQMMQNY